MLFQFNQFQKLAESAFNSSTTLSPSSMSLSSSTTTIPTTSNSFATDTTIAKQLPIGESSTNVPETVTLSQQQPDDITFSFKNLDTPSVARNNVSPGGTASGIITPSRSDYVSYNLLSV